MPAGADDDAERVHASMSMWGHTLRWLISPSPGSRSRRAGRSLRPFANQDERLGTRQAASQDVYVLDVVGEDGDVVTRQLLEAREGADRVEPVVEDGDSHRVRRASVRTLPADDVLHITALDVVDEARR